MKKLIDFEYDLWTTEDGRCMVRVRLAREECEVDRETFRLLRAEEKRLRRELSLPADVEDLSPQAAMTQNNNDTPAQPQPQAMGAARRDPRRSEMLGRDAKSGAVCRPRSCP